MATTLTWLGHAAFRIDTPGGKRVYVDPFLNGNPKCPRRTRWSRSASTRSSSPTGTTTTSATPWRWRRSSTARSTRRSSCAAGSRTQGLSENMAEAYNKGGTIEWEGVKVTLTDANHSSSGFADGRLPLPGRVVRHRARVRGRPEGLLRRRYERLRRHGADRTDLRARRRGAADRRPLHDGTAARPRSPSSCSASSGASPATTARSRSSPARPSSSASWRRGSRSWRRSRAGRSSCEGALVRRHRQAGARARARGLARRRRRARPRGRPRRRAAAGGARAGNAGGRSRVDARGGEGGARPAGGGVGARPDEELLALDLTALTYG